MTDWAAFGALLMELIESLLPRGVKCRLSELGDEMALRSKQAQRMKANDRVLGTGMRFAAD